MSDKNYHPAAVAAWSIYEFLRRIGFPDERIGFGVQDSRLPVGSMRLVVAQARAEGGTMFTMPVAMWPGERQAWEDAWEVLVRDINEGTVPDGTAQEWLNEGANGGYFVTLVEGLLRAGVVSIDDLKKAGAEVEIVRVHESKSENQESN